MDLDKQIFVSASNRASLTLILLILIVGTIFSALIPPLQSPDEPDHIKRAYLLSKGTIILDAPPEGNKTSGGMIDSGLIAYFNTFQVLKFKPDRKLSLDEIDSAKNIKWTGINHFNGAPGTGFYFPIIYLPQAIGLSIGEKLGLTIDTSYHLARFMALMAVAAILFGAFKVYPASPLTIALLIIPMSVFQFSSASLDGVSTALAVFSIATFLRITNEKTNTYPWLFYAFILSIALVASCRAHLLPLLALVLMACFYTKKTRNFIVSAIALCFVIAWTLIASKTTVGFSDVVGTSTANVALFYIANPLAFFDVLKATLSNSDHVKFYLESFLGVLGWLDTRFAPEEYNFILISTILIALLSVSVKTLKTEWAPRFVLLFSAFASIFLIFFALLITWNRHPASLIQGVQGRYFLVPMIMVAYAISGGSKLYEGISRKIAFLLVIFLGAFTIFCTPKLLIERYYLANEQPEKISISLHPSAVLEQSKPIMLSMSKAHKNNLQPLKSISIQFGTYVRKNPGKAELQLTTSNGHKLTIPFDLPELADNQYKYFELDSMPYSSGQIFYLTGGGISTWEAHVGSESEVATCMIFDYTNGKKLYTQGCHRS